jgi:hypothetical protein
MRKKSKKIDASKLRHDDLPASVGLVKEVRNELHSEISSLENKVTALEHKMMAKFDESLAVAHRTQVLMEEQRNENRIVLDGLKTVLERQDRLEARLM